jgi:hypothetical protein
LKEEALSALTGELALEAAMDLSQEGLTLLIQNGSVSLFYKRDCKNLELSTIKIFTVGKSFSVCNNYSFYEVPT